MNTPIAPGLKTTFLVHLVLGLILGLGYLLVPTTVGGILGIDGSDPAWRILGAAILGFSASSWWSYRAEYWEQVRIVVQMEVFWTILGALVTIWTVVGGMIPATGWINVVILLLFAVAFGYYLATSGRRG